MKTMTPEKRAALKARQAEVRAQAAIKAIWQKVLHPTTKVTFRN